MKTPLTLEEADRVFDLVAEAGALEPEQRAAFLAQACLGADGLRAEAESLLGFKTRAPRFLASPAFERGLELLGFSARDDLQPGDTLGDYRVVSLLGSGGMGEVYLADDAVHGRRVALKLIGQGRAEEVRGRHFRHERKVLASLNHPHIARLYGSGVTEKGQAYLVMEYVEGERLDRYCQDLGLDVTARLALFRKVCAAVSYAHQNLVVHRDLKPANIRVTPEGEPKLLDFGIAKLLDPEGTILHVDPTVTMAGAMTPEYASPEQIKGEPVTTASDVYSLGVVLFELLCGQRPYQLKGRRPDELARAICEEEPPHPSTVASRTLPTTAAATMPARQVPLACERPTTLRRLLEGDLDNIVAKALRKEPVRRYPSALALSEDIRRHCEGLPVSARRDTLPYRAGKFVRRNKAGVAAGLLLFFSLVAGLAAASWQARVASGERNRAEQERDRARAAQILAERAQNRAERINDFLETLFGSADPDNGPGRDLKVVQVLDRGSEQLDHDLGAEPAALAQAHQTLGQAYAGLQDLEPALRHLRAALVLDQQIYGDDNIITARCKATLGATLAVIPRDRLAAEPLLRQALVVERQQPVSKQTALPNILRSLADVSLDFDRFDEARALVLESMTVARQANGEESEVYAKSLDMMGVVDLNQGDYAAAEAPLRQSVAIYRKVSPDKSSLAHALTDLAYDLLLQGKPQEAEGILHETLNLIRRLTGEENVGYHFAMALLGFMHYEQQDYPAAEREMRDALIYLAPRYATPNDDIVGARVVLGLSLLRQSRASEAEPYLRDALELSVANHMTGLMSAPAFVRSSLIECLVAQQNYKAAEPLLLAQYSEARQKFGADNPHTAAAAQKLHDFYTAWNKPEEAAHFAGNETHPAH